MKFVIVGYGRVGSRTARVLGEEGHEVVVVDSDPDIVERARNAGFEAYRGDATEESTFDAVDFDTVDAVAGLTSDANANFAACTIGNHHGCRTVLRVDADYRSEIYQEYAGEVDEVVYPEQLGAASAKTALLGGDFSVVADLTEQLQLTTLTVGDGSVAVGQRISELAVPDDARVYAHGRAGDALTIPLPGTELTAGDRLAVIAEPSALDDLRATLSAEAA
jgi:trk system potassium uptake protein TrkA